MTDRKINIGAGSQWYSDGWEILDNAPSKYPKDWQHYGKCWETNLPDDTYDIVFSSHMLEHIPHFRLEKTISEFNRVMKKGATIRILVPSLRKAAEAYVNNDVSFFSGSKHYSNHMGIGASFLRLLISPGGQTVAVSREMDEIFGGYAHLYSFDFEMMKILLAKWGFGNIRECEPGGSEIPELRVHQHVVCDGEQYEMNDPFVVNKKHKKKGHKSYVSGFDKTSSSQLVVEAKKIKDVDYSFDKEYEFNKTSRFNTPVDNIKIFIIKYVCIIVDWLYLIVEKTGFKKIIKLIIK